MASAEELKNNGCQKTYESPGKVNVEINDLQEKVFRIEQQLSAKVDISSEKEADCTQHETIDLKSKLQPKEAKIEKMKYEHLTREAALIEKELLEEEYKKKFDEAKKELSLENDLAGMWVLVAKLKIGALDISDLNVDDRTKV
ncbi:Kinesin-like protein KIN-7K, chloroplastic [Zea mays]|uniref:Kinesin-like protein KIN-7K, chloroplastic n=1 Tax=Zea mays TaxID=4577 RepID=A0A3L6FM77_MAIZE|nr:Kinesin-like protein KIN-7K, chloroplastic [Zea mays]